MAAPKGNNFWEVRTKHGRDRLFETPEILWEACCEYFEWCVENPFKETVFVGKEGTRETVDKIVAFTYEGLCVFLDTNSAYFRQFKQSLKENDPKDFSTVLTRIDDVIRTQKFTRAAAGFLNPMLIARDLGLRDAVDQKSTVEQTTVNVNLTEKDEAIIDKIMKKY